MADWGLPRADGSYAKQGLPYPVPAERSGSAPVPINAGPDGVRLPDETSEVLSELRARALNANEQGEPSTTGTWYLLALADLSREGYDAIEVHFEDTDNADGPPNAIVLHKGVFRGDAG